jgi:polysaccharide chain length determinant protein (PEP-CTERM system associated)
MQFQEALQELITYLRGIWRFRWYAMVIAWAVSIGGWIYIAKMPDQYEAAAKVLVDTDSMLRPLLHGLAVQSNVTQRVQLMTKTLLSRPNLEKVVRMTDMDLKAATASDMDALINQLRDSVRLNGTRTQNLYSLSANHNDPQTAKNIVQALITIFIEDALGNTRQDSDVAQKFLLEQIKEYEARLVEAENRIKLFKQKNIGKMPDAGRDYFEQLQTAQAELEQASLQLRELRKRREELNRQLKGEEPVFGFGTPLSDSVQQSHPLDQRISQMEEKIDDLLLIYTENHPTVIANQAALEELKKEREEDLKNRPQQQFDPSKELAQNPIYQQLKISLAQTEAEISALEVRVNEYFNRVDRYKKLVNTGPEIEAELQSLNRDYALNKQNYDMLVARLESAKLGEQAEQAGDEVKFEIIEPPRVPAKPSGPNRLMFSAAALFFGIAGGVGVGFLLSQLKPVFYDRRTLKAVSGYPVFGVVSRFWSPELLFRKRLEFGIFLAVGAILAMSFAGVLILQRSEFDIAKYLGAIMQ